MAGPQTRGVAPGLYDNTDKLVTALIDKAVKELEPRFTKLFAKKKTNRAFERIMTTAPFGDVPEKPEGAPYQTDLILQAYTKDVYPLEFGLMFEVTETAEEDDQYDELAKKSRYLVFSMRQVQDKRAALVFDNGFTTQTTADGVALFSTVHQLKRGGTARNRPTTDADLSTTSLAQAFIDLDTETKLESGQLAMPATGYYLHIHPANRFNAAQILKSTLLPGTPNNDINPLKELDITPVVNPFLQDTDAWYLVPKNDAAKGLMYLERVPITQPPAMTDARTGNRLYKLRARMTWDSPDWRNSYGTVGA